MWLHASPAHLAVGIGDWIVPATERGGRSRTHPNGYGTDELRWYDPDRVYVMDITGTNPLDQLGRFAFTTGDTSLYIVEPVGPLGVDLDPVAAVARSVTCLRARVVACVHTGGR